ncbi:MAG: hypothetical protein IJ504_01350 [Bacteroidales bacterium]|nr:hypothetical protein [Bacteroidales bacterium]
MVRLLISDDPFAYIRTSLASLLMAVLGLVAMISLALVIIHVVQGDREAAKKVSVWFMATAVGFILISILEKL